MNVLGVNGWRSLSHDASACLIREGRLCAALEEERVARRKHAWDLTPLQSAQFVLREAGLKPDDIEVVAFGWDLSRTRSLSVPDAEALEILFPAAVFPRTGRPPRFRRVPHHVAHAHHAYYSSPFAGERAAVVIVDGAGERESTSLGYADSEIRLEKAFGFETSLGLFYGAACRFLGYSDLDGGKLMALAATAPAEPSPLDDVRFRGGEFVGFPRVRPAGRGEVEVCEATNHAWLAAFREWFGVPPLTWETELSGHFRFERRLDLVIPHRYRVIAACVQRCLDRLMSDLVGHVMHKYDTDRVVLGGGVALNCATNGKLRRQGARLHVPSAPGDAGVAVGAALAVGVEECGSRRVDAATFAPAFLGPEVTAAQVHQTLAELGIAFERVPDPAAAAADLLAEDRLVGWYQGRCEFGPRALGNRSILGHPGGGAVKDRLNALKGRETWRPVGISILAGRAGEVLRDVFESPYMMAAARVRPDALADCPDIAHVDRTTRPQLVEPQANPLYHRLIQQFAARTGWPMVVNTSFNRYDEPIVHSPEDAVRTFFTSALDALVIADCVVRKRPPKESLRPAPAAG